MIKLDHLAIGVRDSSASRDWYARHLGFEVEFEVPARNAFALKDDADFTLFVDQSEPPAPGIAMYFQVDDVDAVAARLAAAGVRFSHPPQKTYWGYGAEALDPDGYRVRLWDETSMRTK
jgi:catechol 2,3-dioxygenase-like lactoylglutathione lyase family enzyme